MTELAKRAALLTGWTEYAQGKGYISPTGELTPYLPQPDEDHGDALRLLEHTLLQTVDGLRISLDCIGGVSWSEWFVSVGVTARSKFTGMGATLPLAITTACVEALDAVQAAREEDAG